MPRGSYTVRHWYCDIKPDELINELKKKNLDAQELEGRIKKIKSHKKHYNGMVKLGKNTEAKEFERKRYCPVVRMVTKHKPSSPVKHSS